MGYYIAEKNHKTGRFELWWSEGEPKEFTRGDAKETYTTAVYLYGKQNVKLLRECRPLVSTTVTMEEEVTNV